jgi:hypothetical protein
MERPAGVSIGRWLGDFTPLTHAEEILLHKAFHGRSADFHSKRPRVKRDHFHIRASFINFILLGGDDNFPTHFNGINISGAYIDEVLYLSYMKSSFPLVFVNCHFESPIYITHGSFPIVALNNCFVPEILGDCVTVSGNFLMRLGSETSGPVRLNRAQIGGNLDFSGSSVLGRDTALSLTGARITGDVHLSGNFRAIGEVCLASADVGGSISLSSASIEHIGGMALHLQGAVVQGNVFLDDGFTSKGKVSLGHARVAGSIFCSGGEFLNSSEHAISAENLRVSGSVMMGQNFRSEGEVCLLGARIEHGLNCNAGQFNNPGKSALHMDHAHIGRYFRTEGAAFDGALLLEAAHVDTLVDDHTAWPEKLVLDGLTYDRIGSASTSDAGLRIQWLNRQVGAHLGKDFRTQPWDQMIGTLRKMGLPEEARLVAIEKQNALRKGGYLAAVPPYPKSTEGRESDMLLHRIRWLSRFLRSKLIRVFHHLFGLISSYGYSPGRVIIFISITYLIFSLTYSYFDIASCAASHDKSSYQCFNLRSGFAYSLDTLLPIELGYGLNFIEKTDSSYQIVKIVSWVEMILGWGFSGIILAIAGRVLRKDA